MVCSVVKVGGTAAIVCGPRAKPKLCKCGAAAQFLCDHKLPSGKECSAPLCGSCTHQPAPGRDLCPWHAPAIEAIDCPYCNGRATSTTGAELYPHRPDLADKKFFWCRPCNAYVGCHPDGRPLGRLADALLRRAKQYVHELFDPLWQNVASAYDGEDNDKLRGVARARAYRWLAEQLQIPVEQCHVGMFDVETCRRAYRIIRESRPTPASIRQWAQARRATP